MKTFSFKIYQSNKNKFLHQKIDIYSEVYNHCIALHKKYYRLTGKFLNRYQLNAHIAKLKKRDKHDHWQQLDAQAIQDITDRIDKAYKLFFRNLKHKIRTSPPSFRKRSKYKSFTLRQNGWKFLDDNKIRIQGKIFKFSKSREIKGRIKTVTIKRDSLGDIYIYFGCEIQEEELNRITTDKSAGFDFGLRTFLTGNDGQQIESPEFFKQGLNKIQQASKQFASKKRGSKNRQRARKNLARKQIKIANHRKDFHFKLARQLCQQYDYLFFEDLNIKGMQRLWGRKVSDLGFAQFIGILKWQAEKLGSDLHFIDRFYPSSKTCSNCFMINQDLKFEKQWTCSNCNSLHDRDLNAAKNIFRVGASTLGLGDVRPASQAISV